MHGCVVHFEVCSLSFLRKEKCAFLKKLRKAHLSRKWMLPVSCVLTQA